MAFPRLRRQCLGICWVAGLRKWVITGSFRPEVVIEHLGGLGRFRLPQACGSKDEVAIGGAAHSLKPAYPRDGGEVRRPPAVVPAGEDIRPRRLGDCALHAGSMGRTWVIRLNQPRHNSQS